MRRSPLEIAFVPLGKLLKNKRAGDDRSIRHRHELAADRSIQLTSSSFEDGGVIPDMHSAIGRGTNASPALEWSPVPRETAQLLLIMEDVDVPFGDPSIHLAVLIDPTITSLPQGALGAENNRLRFVPGHHGRLGYGGPRPLPGHGPHRYHFHLYALDESIPDQAELDSLDTALSHIHGHVIARGHLTGIQEG